MGRASVLFFVLALAGCESNPAMEQWFGVGTSVARDMGYADQAELVTGVKETLEVSSERAAAALSAEGGYARAGYPITLPAEAQNLARTLRKVGLERYVERVEQAMREGAETAAAESVPVFRDTIKNMSVTDALGIIRGGEHAATRYFRSQTESQLRQRYQPIIRASLEKTGFYDQYQALLDTYKAIPMTEKPNLDLEQAVLEQSLNGLFGRMAEEEARIRQDPVSAGSGPSRPRAVPASRAVPAQ